MNKQRIPGTPDEKQLEEILKMMQPVPSEDFHQKMQQAAWRTERLLTQANNAKHLRVRLVFAMTVLLLIAGLLISPQGRAWAQQVFQFFSRINAQTVEIPESQSKLLMEEGPNISYDLPLVPLFIPTVAPEMAVLPGCGTAEEEQSYHCRVALAESQLGFDLKELPVTPQNWKFDSLDFDITSKQARISYTVDPNSPASGSFLLIQGVGDIPSTFAGTLWEAVPADKVEPVKVGGYDGEYVKGSFTFSAPADKTLTWSDSYRHRLAWSDGERWYGITLWPSLPDPESMGSDQLIDLAESLVDSPNESTEALDPDALYSIAEAEEISGFDLKVPTILPLGIDFEYARYYADTDHVRLFYGINKELSIYAWKDRSLDLESRAASLPSYEVVTINGEPALYGSGGGAADAYMFLTWDQDGRLYQIHYAQDFGPTIEKEELIAIAESMQDINDFRKSDFKPYEYISIYEQALGLNVREFPQTPVPWSYDNVWADPLGRCITLWYKPVTGSGRLLVQQCGTDRYFDVSDIPADQTQQVQIGNTKGIYAIGDFVTGDNGELVWNPDLPEKRLYWQEDKLWIEIILFGESAARYDQETLVSYAESLR
jgi:hypothetical protein